MYACICVFTHLCPLSPHLWARPRGHAIRNELDHVQACLALVKQTLEGWAGCGHKGQWDHGPCCCRRSSSQGKWGIYVTAWRVCASWMEGRKGLSRRRPDGVCPRNSMWKDQREARTAWSRNFRTHGWQRLGDYRRDWRAGMIRSYRALQLSWTLVFIQRPVWSPFMHVCDLSRFAIGRISDPSLDRGYLAHIPNLRKELLPPHGRTSTHTQRNEWRKKESSH